MVERTSISLNKKVKKELDKLKLCSDESYESLLRRISQGERITLKKPILEFIDSQRGLMSRSEYIEEILNDFFDVGVDYE